MEYVLIAIVLVVIPGAQLVVRWAGMRGELDAERSARDLAKRGRRLDASPIGDVPEASVVRVLGEVKRLDRWVVAPLSKRPCAHWHLKVSVLEYAPAARRAYWRGLLEQSEGLPFVLGSGSEECMVDPSLATVRIKQGRVDEVKRGRRLPASYADHLEDSGVSVQSLGRTKVLFEESIVGFGSKVAVVGAGRFISRSQDSAVETSYRAPQPSWLCLSGTDDHLLISDERRLLVPRGTGGGIKTEPPRRPELHAPSRTETWASMDVDEFEGRLPGRRLPWRIGIALVGAVIVGALIVAVIVAVIVALVYDKHEPKVAPTEDPCDVEALVRDHAATGAVAIQDKLTHFDGHCTSSLPYRRLHFAVQRAVGNVRAAADDAEQLIEHEPTNAEVWLALAADGRGHDLLRQGVALATSPAHSHAAIETLKHVESRDVSSPCDLELARLELDSSAAELTGECLRQARGHTKVAIAPAVISAKFGAAIARATVDARVGTTIVTAAFAERAGLDLELYRGAAMAALDGKLVRGQLATAPSCAIGDASTNDLPVLITTHLPDNLDAVIGLDFLWRFARSPHAQGVELFERNVVEPREVE